MKGLILAGVSLGFFVMACSAILRIYRGDKEYRIFLGCFGSALILYAVLFRALPRDLGFLPAGALEPSAVVDFVNGAVVLSLIFHGLWTFTYMVWTGPTMRLLMEMGRNRDRGMSEDEALRHFWSGGRENTLLRRRLPKLMSGGYLTEEDGVYRLLPRGRAVGRLLIRVRQAIGDRE